METPINATNAAIARAIGAELRASREASGRTREQLAAHLHLDDNQAILAYENGDETLMTSDLVTLCDALGVSAPELLRQALDRADDSERHHSSD